MFFVRIISSLLVIASSAPMVMGAEVAPQIVQDGQPFGAVESGKGAGVYTRGADSSWQQIVKGELLANPITGVIISQLKLHTLDSRYEIASIINGRLTLLNVKSSEEQSESIPKFGEGSAKPYDPISGRYFEVPLITAAEDVNVYDAIADNNLVFIVSVRDKYSPDPSAGLTFAAIIRPTVSKKNDEKPAGQFDIKSITVLDDQFRDESELRLLHQGQRLISKNLFQYLARPDRRYHGIEEVDRWKQQFSAFAYDLDSVAKNDIKKVAFYLDGEIKVPYTPRVELLDGRVVQHFDPNGADYVEFSGIGHKEMGRLDWVDGKPAIFSHSSASVYFIGGNAYLLTEELQSPMRMRGLRSPVLSLLSFEYESDERTYQVFLISEQYQSGEGATQIFRFLKTRSSELVLEDQVMINREFYTQQELEIRHRTDVSNSPHIFDTVTANQKGSTGGYEQAYEANQPHIDLLKSSSSGLEYAFIKPIEAIKLVGDEFLYLVYLDENLDRNKRRTGLYFPEPPARNATKFVGGELLRSEGGKGDRILAKKKLEVKDKNHNTKVEFTLVALDRSYGSGQNGFTANLTIQIENGRSQITTVPFNVKENFIRNKGFDIIPGGIKGDDYYFHLVSFQDESNRDKNVTKVKMDSFKVGLLPNQSGYLDIKLNGSQEHRVSNDVGLADLPQRIIFDNVGRSYWVINPEIDPNDPDFRVLDILANKSISPNDRHNRSRFTKPKDGETDYASGAFSSYNSWIADSAYSMAIKDLTTSRSDLEASFLFSDLSEKFHDLIRGDPQNTVVLVNDEIEAEAISTIVNEWAFSENRYGWSIRNPKLKLFVPRKKGVVPGKSAYASIDQSEYFDNFDIIQQSMSKQKVPVLFTSLSKIGEMGSPTSAEGETYRSPAFVKQADSEGIRQDSESRRAETEEDENMVVPSALNLFVTEGRKVDPNNLKLGSVIPTFSKIFVGTKEQWESMTSRSNLPEEVFANWNQITYERPADQALEVHMNRLFDSPEVRKLGYKFEIDRTYSDSEAKKELLTYCVAKVKTLALEFNHPPFTTFIKLYNLLKSKVMDDPRWLARRVVRRVDIDLMFTEVFPKLPLTLDLLPDDDPLKLAAHPSAKVAITKEGYRGAWELKDAMLAIMLAKTKTSDSIPVPSSYMLVGPTGTGKTSLVKAIWRALGIKEYKWHTASSDGDENKYANGIIVPVKNLVADNNASTHNMMSVDHVIASLTRHLARPGGHMTHILFDDLHDSTPEVREPLLTWIKSIVDSQTGTIVVRGEQRGYVEIPVRNITLGITVNPTAKKARIKEFTGDSWREPTMEEHVIATLSTDNNELGEHFLRRFNRILPVKDFPFDAKGPALVAEISDASRKIFTTSARFISVEPSVINALSQTFAHLDARRFSNLVGAEIVDLATQTDANTKATIVKLKGDVKQLLASIKSGSSSKSGPSVEEQVKKILADEVVVHSLNEENIEGLLEILQIAIDKFRLAVVEGFVESIQDNEILSFDESTRVNNQSPLLVSLWHYINTHSEYPISLANISENSLGLQKSSQKEQLRKFLGESKRQAEIYYPVSFGFGQKEDVIKKISRPEITDDQLESRSKLMGRYVVRLTKILNLQLDKFVRNSTWSESRKSSLILTNALDSIEAFDEEGVRSLNDQLVKVLIEFLQDFESERLLETNDSSYQSTTYYDSMQFFMMCLDKAMSRLPWSDTGRLLNSIAYQVTRNFSVGTNKLLQDMLFDAHSLYRPAATDVLEQLIRTSKAVQKWTEERQTRVQSNFSNNCQRMILEDPK